MSAFEYMQNVQIQVILHMHKVSPAPLLTIHIFCSIKKICKRTVKAQSDCMDVQSDLGLHCPHMLKDRFSHGAAHLASKFLMVPFCMVVNILRSIWSQL